MEKKPVPTTFILKTSNIDSGEATFDFTGDRRTFAAMLIAASLKYPEVGEIIQVVAKHLSELEEKN